MSRPTGERPAVEPPHRRYAESKAPRPAEDEDTALAGFRRQAAGSGIIIGVVFVPIGLMLSYKVGAEPPVSYLFLLVGPVAGYFVYRFALAVSDGSGAVVGNIHHPTGSTTPPVREYSRAQALAVRGNYREAIAVYEDAVTLHPEDPEPYIAVARLYRDKLRDYERAVSWFKRARRESTLAPAREMLVTQEIIEVYRNRLGEPSRAIPELARLVDRFGDQPGMDAVRRELRELREGIAGGS